MSVEKTTAVDDGELLDDVFASDRDRGADSVAPESADTDQPEVEADPVSDGETKDDSPKQYRDPENGRFVPLTELKTERTKRQEEARLRAEAEQRAAVAEAALNEARRFADHGQRQRYQQPEQAQPEIPDPFTDPEGYRAHVVQEAQMHALSERLNVSQMIAEEKYGVDVVAKALQAAEQAGVKQSFVRSRHPYGDLVTWHQRQAALAEIGPDPTAYEQRIREKVLAELKAGSAPKQRFPGTLADASSAGGQGKVLTDEAIVDDLFDSSRKRRA